MYTPVYTGQFKRDVKLAQRRGKDLDKFKGAEGSAFHFPLLGLRGRL